MKEGEGEDEFRHRCLVRQIIRWRVTDRDLAHRFLKGWSSPEGRWVKGWNELHPESKLEQDIKKQWNLGNRGENGDWK